MRILLCNYRYFVSGGPERYMFNVAGALADHGHDVIPFSIRYQQNQDTPYSGYFAEPLAAPDQVYYREQDWTPRTTWRTVSRLFYARDVEKAVTRLAKDTNPQIAYVLQYLRKMSPSLLVGLKGAGLPIVARLSDYAMLCPQMHFLRDNTPCELCSGGNLLPSIRYGCVQDDLAISALNALATQYHRVLRFFDLIDVFVTTTRFMYERLVGAGYPEKRLCYIPTFVNTAVFRPAFEEPKQLYVAYAGRLDQIKGVHVLIEALALLRAKIPGTNLKIKIVGSGAPQYTALLKQQVGRLDCGSHVEFLGQLTTEEMVPFLNNAFLTVVPSLWYENLPNVVLESYACGTPVLASNLGSLPECVVEGQTGYLFGPGNSDDLAERLAYCLDRPRHVAGMGRNARAIAETTYSETEHVEKLEALLGELVRLKVS